MFQNLTTALIAMYTRLMCGDLQLVRVETRRRSRAATFIEYALLAGVGVTLIVLFRTRIQTTIDSLLSRLDSSFGGQGS